MSGGFQANNDYGFGVTQDFQIKKKSEQGRYIQLKQGKLKHVHSTTSRNHGRLTSSFAVTIPKKLL